MLVPSVAMIFGQLPMANCQLLFHLYVTSAGSSRCGSVLNELNVNLPPENRNSLQEQLRAIQAIWRVFCGERSSARCMVTPTGPPELKTTTFSPLPPLHASPKPRRTRAQNSGHDSTFSTCTSPATHLPITASKSR